MLARGVFQPAQKPRGFVAPRRVLAALVSSGRQGAIVATTTAGEDGLSGFPKLASLAAAARRGGAAVALGRAPAWRSGPVAAARDASFGKPLTPSSPAVVVATIAPCRPQMLAPFEPP